MLAGSFYLGSHYVTGQALNISSGGVYLTAGTLAEPGSHLELRLARFGKLPARVVWADGDRMGACFTDESGEIALRIGHILPAEQTERT